MSGRKKGTPNLKREVQKARKSHNLAADALFWEEFFMNTPLGLQWYRENGNKNYTFADFVRLTSYEVQYLKQTAPILWNLSQRWGK